jgi:hypothetical protein
MKRSPSLETNGSASQEIPRILCTPKFQYHIHKIAGHVMCVFIVHYNLVCNIFHSEKKSANIETILSSYS